MKKILIIDDERDIVKVLTARLTIHGFETISATDGESGYEKACRYLPDIILMDVMMPGWTGFETAGKLQENSATSNIPIIFLTAFNNDSMARKYLEIRNSFVLSKPFMIEELLECLSKELGM